MTVRRCGVGVLAIALVVGIAGCAAPVAPATHASSPVATPTPAATRPTLDQLTIDPDGFGPLRIGQPVPTLPDAISPVGWDASKCYKAGVSQPVGAPGVGAWSPRYPDVAFEHGTDSAFSLYTVDDTEAANIESLWAWTSDLKTSKGVSVDSSLAELQAAYPHVDATIPSDYVTAYVVEGSAGQLIFEVATQPTEDATFWTADKLGTVRVIHDQLKTEKAYAISGSSDGLGVCSLAPGFSG